MIIPKTKTVLLDLNYTLVGNSRQLKPFIFDDNELYDDDLIKLLDGYKIILITVRNKRYINSTYDNLKKHGVLNKLNIIKVICPLEGEQIKAHIFKGREIAKILASGEYKAEDFFGIESNEFTRCAYRQLNIECLHKRDILSNRNVQTLM